MRVEIDSASLLGSFERTQRLRNALRNRGPLNARLAAFGSRKLQDDLAATQQHRTANRLGARPTNHLQRVATQIRGISDDASATILLPRASRLRAAFGTHVILPTGGRKWLTIPDHESTYGKRAGEIAEPLAFAMVGGRFPALVFSGRGPKNGTVAYWLKRQVTIEEDATLIPFDVLLADLADEALEYLEEVVEG